MSEQYTYTDMTDAIERLHGKLVAVRDGFNNSVQALKEMQDIDKVIRVTLGDRLLPLTTDPELKQRIVRMNYTDERFTMKLANILAKASGEERIDLLSTCASELCGLFVECQSKRVKLEERTRLANRYTTDENGKRIENPEYLVACRKLNEIRITQSKIGTKMNFVVRKFFATRKQLLNRIVGASEMFFKTLKDNGQVIGDNFFKTYGVRQIAEELVETDRKGASK